MGLPVGELAAYPLDKNGPVLLCDGVLPLLGTKAGIALQELFGRYEEYLFRQHGRNLRELYVELVLRYFHGLVDAADGLVQEGFVPFLRQHHLFPVPLVHIDGMDVVQVFVGPKGVHIRIDAAAGNDSQLGQLETLPLGQGVHHLGGSLVHALDREPHRALHSVEVVVKALPGEHHHGRRHAQQGQLGAQVFLEHVFNGFDGLLRLLNATEQIAVIGRNIH